MKIQFRNIGLLKDVNLDLTKDLILLCGPNNTGKTFAAYCTYGIYQCATRNLQPVFLQDASFNELLSKGVLTLNILDFFKSHEKRILDFITRKFKSELPNIFATTSDFFSNSECKIILDKNEIENRLLLKEIKSQYKFGTNLTITINKETNSPEVKLLIIEEKDVEKKASQLLKEILPSFVQSRLVEKIVEQIFANTYIAPAERTAINIFSKELSVIRNEIVDKLLYYKDDRKGNNVLEKAQRYPLPIKDSLAIAEDLANLQKNKTEFDYLATAIEKEILKGKMKISKEGEVLFSPNRSIIKNLKIHLTASIVKSLSNLVFYFRHIAKRGDFIIIDEPELNLHPDNQRIIARVLAIIVNNGFKVMISTHSDYIIREINNLIMLKSGGNKSIDLIKKYHYKHEELLDYNNIGVYLFANNSFNPLEVSETGFEISTIDKEINSINESSQDIYLSLF